mmetsp:Transcript_7712/g.19201  ORF Transcript_7712/g.19201 Transcript_7712/m.19201 type:complete len:256 (+) Transcript_7712:177-944(+)
MGDAQNIQKEDRDSDQHLEKSSNTNSNASRKRKRTTGSALREAYSAVSFCPRKFTNAPDSPSFFFPSSYDFTLSESKLDDERKDANGSGGDNGCLDIQQVVHHHVNGLCMVTAGELSIPPTMVVKSIRFVAKEAPPCSNAGKRKRQAKMLSGRGKVDETGVVGPSTVIAELVLEEKMDGDVPGGEQVTDVVHGKTTIVPLRACVWGTILELNTSALTPQVLLNDPLLDGYIAIILPSGRFPPPESEAVPQSDQAE